MKQTIQRNYIMKKVSNLTLQQIQKIIDTEEIKYSGDYGLKFQNNNVQLIYSEN